MEMKATLFPYSKDGGNRMLLLRRMLTRERGNEGGRKGSGWERIRMASQSINPGVCTNGRRRKGNGVPSELRKYKQLYRLCHRQGCQWPGVWGGIKSWKGVLFNWWSRRAGAEFGVFRTYFGHVCVNLCVYKSGWNGIYSIVVERHKIVRPKARSNDGIGSWVFRQISNELVGFYVL